MDCDDPLSTDDGGGGLIILLLPWAVWTGAVFVLRATGSECCAKRWTPPQTMTMAPQVAVMSQQPAVSGVVVASVAHPEP